MNSLLRLETYELKSLSLVSLKKRNDVEKSEDIRIRPALKQARARPRFFVSFSIKVAFPSGLHEVASLAFVVEGQFSLPEGTPEEVVKNYIPLLCVTNLLGLARGHLAQITSLCAGGPYILPLLNVGGIVEELKAKRKKAQKSPSSGKQ